MNTRGDEPALTEQGHGFPLAERNCPALRNDWVNARYTHLEVEADESLPRAKARKSGCVSSQPI
jgi:hypothetical protein